MSMLYTKIWIDDWNATGAGIPVRLIKLTLAARGRSSAGGVGQAVIGSENAYRIFA